MLLGNAGRCAGVTDAFGGMGARMGMAETRGRIRGALEERLMGLLWDARRALTVRDVCDRLDSELSYTTVMTTLARLHAKRLLARDRDGLAFRYEPALTRAQYHEQLVDRAVTPLLQRSADAVLAHFVDLAAGIDEDNLRRLEELIAARRERRGEEGSQ